MPPKKPTTGAHKALIKKKYIVDLIKADFDGDVEKYRHQTGLDVRVDLVLQ